MKARKKYACLETLENDAKQLCHEVQNQLPGSFHKSMTSSNSCLKQDL